MFTKLSNSWPLTQCFSPIQYVNLWDTTLVQGSSIWPTKSWCDCRFSYQPSWSHIWLFRCDPYLLEWRSAATPALILILQNSNYVALAIKPWNLKPHYDTWPSTHITSIIALKRNAPLCYTRGKPGSSPFFFTLEMKQGEKPWREC